MIEKKASAKNERKPYAPTEGFLYRNRGGGVFRCVSNALGRTTATMVNVKSGGCSPHTASGDIPMTV